MQQLNPVCIVMLDDTTVVKPGPDHEFHGVDQWGVRVHSKTETGSITRTIRWAEMRQCFFSLGLVRLTAPGRVLNGRVGDEFHVVKSGLGVEGDQVLVVDTRDGLHHTHALWSLGPDDFTWTTDDDEEKAEPKDTITLALEDIDEARKDLKAVDLALANVNVYADHPRLDLQEAFATITQALDGAEAEWDEARVEVHFAEAEDEGKHPMVALTIEDDEGRHERVACYEHKRYGSGVQVVGSKVIEAPAEACVTCQAQARAELTEEERVEIARQAWAMQEAMPESVPSEVVDALRQTWTGNGNVDQAALHAYRTIVNG